MLEELLHWMGYGLCHQLPERSFFGGGVQVPVCARDTGIYLGFAISFIVVWLLHAGGRPRGFPPPIAWAFMAVFLGAMGFDGVSSYAGWRETTNDLRLITGLGVGFSAAAVVYPMLQDELWRIQSPQRVLDPWWRLAVWLASMAAAFQVIRSFGPLMGVGYPILVASSILLTLSSVNLVIVAMLPWFDRRGERFSDLTVPILLALVLAVLEIVAAGYVRVLLEGMARGFA